MLRVLLHLRRVHLRAVPAVHPRVGVGAHLLRVRRRLIRGVTPRVLLAVHPRRGRELRLLVRRAVRRGAAAVDDVNDRPGRGVDAVRVARDGDEARRHALVDLNPRARLRLQPLDRLAAAADDASDHVLRALHDLLRLAGADAAAAHGAALEQVLHELRRDVDASGGARDGDLSRRAVGIVLIDRDVRAALRLQAFDRLPALADDPSD
mmetsp:Transcript_41248/g.98642  ORF Transcript_41248/g.98642 Transcript_41248/m.98642 type:complete len:208 (-) Transcript_41248:118-741(-)